MIEIRFADGRSLELRPNTEISFELVSPLFTDQVGYGSASYSFVVDPSPTNVDLLERSQLITKPQNAYSWTVRLYLVGYFWCVATVKLKNVLHSGAFQILLEVSESAIATALAGRSLKDWSYGGDRVISAATGSAGTHDLITHANAVAAGDVDTYDYAFPTIRNEGYYDQEPIISFPYLWGINFFRNGTYQHIEDGITSGDSEWMTSMVPMFYALYILRHHATEAGYTFLDDGLFTDYPEMKQLILYNTYALDGVKYTFVYGGGGRGVAAHWKPRITPTNHLPEMKALAFWRGLLQHYNCAPLVVGNTITFWPKVSSLNGTLPQIDWRTKVLAADWETYPYDRPGKYRLTPDGDDATITQPATSEPTYTVATFAALPGSPLSGETALVGQTNILYVYDGSAWEELGRFGPAAFVTDTTLKSELVSPFGSLPMIREAWGPNDVPPPGRMRVPLADQPGNVASWKQVEQPFSPRLLFYRGLTDEAGTDDVSGSLAPEPYPYASSDGHPESGGWEQCVWFQGGEGEAVRGAYYDWHQRWAVAMDAAKQIPARMDLLPSDIRRIDWRSPYRIRVPDGEAKALIKRVKFSVSQQGLGVSNVDFVTIS